MKTITKQFCTSCDELAQEQIPTNADVCELAHTLTVRECRLRNIQLSKYEDDYTLESKEIFDYYYETITNILGL